MMTGYYTTINQLVTKIKKVHASLSDDDLNNSEIIELQNNLDGRGDYIKKWKHPSLAKPTQDQLDAV
ncbi:uncharacterized protein METZ01_LOCUS119900 [marine metagenome]|uniref:Uncharacterized protein n=1 Tax=marine metagenome TaxID=408172 RepID=A0A381XQI4_9ZZZZ